MASKKDAKPADAPKKSGGGIMLLLPKIPGVLAIVSAAILFAGLYDVGHIGLYKMLSPLAIVPLALYALCAIAATFMGGSKSGPVQLDGEDLAAKIDEVQSRTNTRIGALQVSIDAMSGQDYETLVAENKTLKEQLDAIHDAERGKIDSEVEQLRAKNEELENQIKEWAVKAVGATFDGEETDSVEAA